MVSRTVFASKLYAMVHGFDAGAAIKSTLDQALNVNLSLELCTDSHSLFDCLVKLGTTLEKRLMIDVMYLVAKVILESAGGWFRCEVVQFSKSSTKYPQYEWWR